LHEAPSAWLLKLPGKKEPDIPQTPPIAPDTDNPQVKGSALPIPIARFIIPVSCSGVVFKTDTLTVLPLD
jgi:hypothetical protein